MHLPFGHHDDPHLIRRPGIWNCAGHSDPFGTSGKQRPCCEHHALEIIHRHARQAGQFKSVGRQAVCQCGEPASVNVSDPLGAVDSVLLIADHGVDDNAQVGPIREQGLDPGAQRYRLAGVSEIPHLDGTQRIQRTTRGQVLQVAVEPFDRECAAVDRGIARDVAQHHGRHGSHGQAKGFQRGHGSIVSNAPINHLRLH